MGWLLKIAKNMAADYNRKHHEVQSLSQMTENGALESILPAPTENLEENLDRKEEYLAVLEGLNRLPDKYRLVIMLRYFEGLSGSEIALILGEPEGTIRNRIFRALEKIRQIVQRSPLAKPGRTQQESGRD